MTYYVSQDGGVRRSKLWNFAKKKNGRVVEKLRSFHMLHPDVFARTCLCCFAFVAVGWYLWNFVNRGQSKHSATEMLVLKKQLPLSIQYYPIQFHLAKRGEFFFGVCFSEVLFCFANCSFLHLSIFAELSASWLYISPFVSVFLREKIWKNRSSYICWQILHRDIKPANILLFEQVGVVWLDHWGPQRVFLGGCWARRFWELFYFAWEMQIQFFEVLMMVILIWNY